MNRLLIISCSQRKNPAKGLLPAIDRYDGPAFRVLRKYLRETVGPLPTVLILSAKYGLITTDRKIPNYDRRISPSCAKELQPRILGTIRATIVSNSWGVVGICASQRYQLALVGLSALLPDEVRVDVIRGGQGRRLTALKNWLAKS